MSHATMTVALRPDGTVIGLYSDLLSLSPLGKVKITRGSYVEWNARRQRWEVTLPGSRRHPLFSSTLREPCLRWEAKHLLNTILKNEVNHAVCVD